MDLNVFKVYHERWPIKRIITAQYTSLLNTHSEIEIKTGEIVNMYLFE